MRIFLSQGDVLLFVKWVVIISRDVPLFGRVLGWTYHYSNNSMTWEDAEKYCQAHFTNLMVIRNLAENHNLTENLPEKDKYYWLGLRKANNSWRWTGTNEALEHDAWATNEPNNVKDNEDCVELYVNRGPNRGKWNDEKCSYRKYALCYRAQCNATICQGRGRCRETFNNYSCDCDPGFGGQHCEDAVACHVSDFVCFEDARHRTVECEASSLDDCALNCSGGPWNCTCTFRCSRGVQLLGPKKMTCNSEGIWTEQRPVCIDYRTFAMAVVGAGFLSCSCFVLFCFMHDRKRRRKNVRPRKEDEGGVRPRSQT